MHMKSLNLKQVMLLCAVTIILPITSFAQYNYYTGHDLDHTYLNVKEIGEDEQSIIGGGYVIGTTVIEPSNPATAVGEITRTRIDGSLAWVNTYFTTSGPARHRFNHIEKYTFNGNVEYFVVGSLVDGGITTLLAALIDDNGNVLASQEYRSVNHDHLLGIKGIAVSDRTFALVALEAGGFNATDSKNVVVMKLDAGLNMTSSMTMSSPNVTNDYDTPTDIIEGENVEDFFVVGTSNKDAGSGNSQPCAFATLVNVPSNTVIWSHNYSTALGGHWDAAADGYYDGRHFWVLANSSIVHYYNLVELDPVNGNVLNEIQYTDVTYGNDFNHYGYELKRALDSDEELVISGWKGNFSDNSVQPFLLQVNPTTSAIKWHWKYNGYNNAQMGVNENSWLYVRAAAQFPYYYNDMMSYRADYKGYTMLSTDDASSNEDILFWYATDLNGKVNEDCGFEEPKADTLKRRFHYNDPLKKTTNNIDFGMNRFLEAKPITYDAKGCGEFSKNGGVINSTEENLGCIMKVYPNPANNSLYIDGEDIEEVVISDLFGRVVLKQKANAQQVVTLNVSTISNGIYLVNVKTLSGEMRTHKVEIVK